MKPSRELELAISTDGLCLPIHRHCYNLQEFYLILHPVCMVICRSEAEGSIIRSPDLSSSHFVVYRVSRLKQATFVDGLAPGLLQAAFGLTSMEKVSQGPCKMYGLYRAKTHGVWGKDIFYTYKQRGGTFFRKHIYGENTFLFIFI